MKQTPYAVEIERQLNAHRRRAPWLRLLTGGRLREAYLISLYRMAMRKLFDDEFPGLH
jgi:hypothetical protein